MPRNFDGPMLKYSKFHSQSIVEKGKDGPADPDSRTMITAIATTDRFIAIGSSSGNILLLDAQGNVIKEWNNSHSATINHIEIDSTKEFIASASTDGTVVISSLYNTADSSVHNFKSPIFDVALEHDFGKRSTRQFVCGGPAGLLIMTTKGWFGPSQAILHKDDGAITRITWKGSYIVWTNDKGVNIYDSTTSTKIGHIGWSGNLTKGDDLFKYNICWTGPSTFIIGWGNYVKIVGLNGTKQAQIISQFETDYIVAGVAPFDSSVLILGSRGSVKEVLATLHDESKEKDQLVEPPEIHIVDFEGTEIAKDVLSMAGSFSPFSYRLISLLQDDKVSSGTSADYVFYISSPQDVICAKPRDAKDHVAWLLESGHFQPALNLLEKSTNEYTAREKEETILDIGQKLIEKLLHDGSFAEAAEWCPKVLGTSEKVWEKWVLAFIEARHFKALLPYIPIENPTLSHSIYDCILNEFLQTDLDDFHKQVIKWPTHIYTIKNIIESVQSLLNSAADKMKLYSILADMCERDKQLEQAIYYNMLQGKPGQAERIEKANLFYFLHSNVLVVMEYAVQQCQSSSSQPKPSHEVARACAASKSLQILVTSTDIAPIPHCVSILSPVPFLLHIYLDALFTLGDVSESGQVFQDRQVELYAEYDPTRLLDFLRTASSFSYPKAYTICETKDLVPEMLYLLGKMGDTRTALYLIVERVGDVGMAIDFAKEHNDASLWSEFLKYAIDKPDFIVGLLRHCGGHIDPLQIIGKIPRDLKIPDLKAAVIQIMTDCSVQLSLREGCEQILQSDIWDTFAELTRAQRRGPKLTPASICSMCEESITEPLDHLMVFYCSHYFHASCIKANISLIDDSADGMDTKRAKLAVLDKAIDYVYNQSSRSSIPSIASITESTWIDTQSISCPLCS